MYPPHVYSQGTSKKIEIPCNPEQYFYYSNIYKNQDEVRAMPSNVRFDLEPFRDFIDRSIKSIENSHDVGADVVIPDSNVYLEILDSLVKIKKSEGIIHKIQKPQFKLFRVDFAGDAEINSLKDIEEITIGRSDSLWKNGAENQAFFLEGNLYLSVSRSDIVENQKVKIWLANGDDLNAFLKPIPASNFALYKITPEHAQNIISVSEEADFLYVISNAKAEKFTILGCDFPVLEVVQNSNNDEKDDIQFRTNGKPYKVEFLEKNLYAIKNCPISQCRDGKLFIGESETEFSVCTREEILSYINDNRIKLNGDDFFCPNEADIFSDGSENGKIIIGGIEFKRINIDKTKRKLRLKDKNGKPVGIVVELLEDDSYKNEVYSNLDVFFSEGTVELTDNPNRKIRNRKLFRIGWSNRELSQMEIALESGKGLVSVGIDEIPEKLYAVIDTSQLKKQKMALNRLMYSPLPAHAPLLELTEKKQFANWEKFELINIERWYRLTDLSYEGCKTQRTFVKKALSTPDFAFLDGPPGSGKTTTILEIIAQAIMQGKKVMLAASTNAAVDNILERLPDLPSDVQEEIFAVRIGSRDAISEKVDAYNIFNVDDVDVQNEIIRRANLVCSTIFGILKHPEFNLQNPAQPAVPLYDYLIIDEASKTTFQDFLVPALYAKRWIFSGDLNQLTPYTEQETLVSSIEENEKFSREHQYVETILYTLKKNCSVLSKLRLCLPSKPLVIKAANELAKDFSSELKVAILDETNLGDFLSGGKTAVKAYGAEVLFVEEKIFEKYQSFLPSDFVAVLNSEELDIDYSVALNKGAGLYSKKLGIDFAKNTCDSIDDFSSKLKGELREHSWANELVWRLCRIQELFLSSESKKIQNYENQIQELIPESFRDAVENEINLVKSIALPSVLQLLQNGIRDEVVKNKKSTTLNSGFEKTIFETRHEILEFQHRMHPAISKFSKENFYRGTALQDPTDMEEKRAWNCNLWKSRSEWIDVQNQNDSRSFNPKEVSFIIRGLKSFISFTEKNPHGEKPGEKNWTLAILTYYRKQEREIKSSVKELFGAKRERSFYKDDNKNIEVKIFTVDKFQGQEADVVFISLVKSGNAPLGFMDSPNRLNVALTRAKFQRIIFGSRDYFTRKGGSLLKLLERSVGVGK